MIDQEGQVIGLRLCLIHNRTCFPSGECDEDYEQDTMKAWSVTTPVPKQTLETHFHEVIYNIIHPATSLDQWLSTSVVIKNK